MQQRLRSWALAIPLGLSVAVAGTAAGGQTKAPGSATARPATSALAASASATATASPAPQAPVTDEEKADAWYREALEAGKVRDWPRAYELLSEAARIKRSHDILGNLGTVEFKLGRYRDAAEHFTASLKLYPVNGRPEGKAFSQALLDEAKTHVATLFLEIAPESAKVRVNGTEVGPADRDVVFLEPGEVLVEVGGVPGYEPERRALTISKGKTETVKLSLGAQGGMAGGANLAVIGVGGGVAALAAGFGIGFAVAAADTRAAADKQLQLVRTTPGAGPCSSSSTSAPCKELADIAGRHDAFAAASTGAFIGAGALAAGTLIYALVSPKRAPVKAGAVVTPTAAVLSLHGSF